MTLLSWLPESFIGAVIYSYMNLKKENYRKERWRTSRYIARAEPHMTSHVTPNIHSLTYFLLCLYRLAIQSFALDHGISDNLAAWLLSIINPASVFGRTIPNWLADHYGMLEVYVPCTAAGAAIVFAMRAATNPGGIVVVCIHYGFLSGSIVSLYFPTVCALDPHVGSTGVHLGIACLPVGVASLVGTPIAEALVGQNSWWHGFAFAGASEMVSAVLLAFAWVMERRRKATKRS